MSKCYSGHFNNRKSIENATIGTKHIKGTIPSFQRQLAIEYAQKLLNGENKKIKKIVNTVTLAYDENTGKIYYGCNHGIELNNAPINPILQSLLPKTSLNQFPLANCAECDAINNALNGGSKLENLHIYTISATKKKMGIPKPSCENCTYAFKGKVKSNNSGWIK